MLKGAKRLSRLAQRTRLLISPEILRGMEGVWQRDPNASDATRVMQAWLQGRGEKEYPPTWEGLYKLLRDVRKEAVVPVLREAVDRAVLPGTSRRSTLPPGRGSTSCCETSGKRLLFQF